MVQLRVPPDQHIWVLRQLIGVHTCKQIIFNIKDKPTGSKINIGYQMGYSSVVENSTAHRKVHGLTPCAPCQSFLVSEDIQRNDVDALMSDIIC